MRMRYNDYDLDQMPPYLGQIANDFQICLTVKNSNDFKGPYILSQVLVNYLFKLDDTDFQVGLFSILYP